MVAEAASRIDLAVSLFERGFSEDRVESALRETSTLDEALKWLKFSSPGSVDIGNIIKDRRDSGLADADRTASVKACPTAMREQAPTTACSSSASSVRAKGTSAGSTDNGDGFRSPTAFSVATSMDVDRGLLDSPRHHELPVLSIEPRDASSWWAENAARWPNIANGLRRQAATSIVRSAGTPFSSPSAMTPRRKRSIADMEEDAESTAQASSRSRQDEDEKFGRSSSARPPASPLRGEASGSLQCSPCRTSTPVSSPCAMKLSSEEETCTICYCDADAYNACKLACSHGWYCAKCMLHHAEARLAVGAASITCPECNVPLAERELRKLLPPEVIERLLARSLEQAVSSVSDICACPTPNCPMRVALEEGAVPRFKCTMCKKDSCLRCGVQPFHKGLSCDEFQDKQRNKDEDGLMKWIEETGTKQCPTCRMAITKENLDRQNTQYKECHKMVCRNCTTRFCFKCLTVLTDSHTCGCSINAHGFVNPLTGKRLDHLRPTRGRPASKKKAK